MSNSDRDRIVLGKIVGLFGVQGWVKIFSDTDPRENIFSYKPWQVKVKGEWQTVKVLSGRKQGKGLVVSLDGLNDREEARLLIGAEIAILKSQLPKLKQGEYYWADLIGLEVENLEGVSLGKVDHLFSTGANDVMVVKGERERLVPFVREHYVHDVDLEAGIIRVDWDPEF